MLKLILLSNGSQPRIEVNVAGLDVKEHGMRLIFKNLVACQEIFPGHKLPFFELFWDYRAGGVLFKGTRYTSWSVVPA